jgi:circadian clock protein KaiC
MIKDQGITLFVTALSETDDTQAESTDLQISTIADTWIHLSYLVRSGERNRALTIVKSRGTAHSNQVRELVLNNSGPTLTDVYSAGGEVLMARCAGKRNPRKAQEDPAPRELTISAAGCSLPK